MIPTSLPAIPAQPELPSYGITALSLFQPWTRETFQAAFGQQAPPYDPSQPTRTWFDTSAQPGPYLAIQVTGGSPAIVPLPMPANVALPNLAGAYRYPAWVNSSSTPAQIQWPGFAPEPLGNPAELCSLADAQAVAAALPSGTTVSEDSMDASVIWGSETRRMYVVNIPGGPSLNAAFLRAMMTRQITDPQGNVLGGAGAPGSFIISGDNASWNLTPDPGLTAGPALPVPCRPLLPNEVFEAGLLGAGVMIVRTDMQPQPVSAGLSAAQAAWALAVLEAINVQQKLGLPAPPAS